MASPAYLPLFPADYLADTRHLSTEEHGAYLLLMMTAWSQDDCALPDDDRKLARITGLSLRKWKLMREVMLDFWTVENGRWRNRRLSKERNYVDQKSASNRENANRRWSKQVVENKQPASCDRISDGNAPYPQPQNIEEPNGSSSPPTPSRSPSKKTRSAGGVDHPLPDDFAPVLTARAQEMWDALRDPERELRKFKDHALANGRLAKDWQAALRTWLENAIEFQERNRTNDRTTQAGRGGDRPRNDRDNRDGFERALDRRLGLD